MLEAIIGKVLSILGSGLASGRFGLRQFLLEVSPLLLCCSKVDSSPTYSGNCFFMRKHAALIESGTDSEIVSRSS